jgi:hypothetical protein
MDLGLTGVPELDQLLLVNLPLSSLKDVCQTNSYLNSICQDDYFWKLKVEHDFLPIITAFKPLDETYLEQYQYLLQISPNEAATDGRVDALILNEMKGILPNVWGANWAAENGHLNVLKWLEERKIFPNERGANFAAENGHLDVLEWLEEKGIRPNKMGANFAAENGNLDVLEWLEEKGIRPDALGANYAALYGYLNVLKWLEKEAFFQTHKGLFGLNNIAIGMF